MYTREHLCLLLEGKIKSRLCLLMTLLQSQKWACLHEVSILILFEIASLTNRDYTFPRMLSLLGTGWSPVLNTESLCLSIQSMLASCKKKERPPGNDRYVKNAPISPKDTTGMYEDDNV